MSGITVVVPVGPDPRYREYLGECVQSIVEQMQEEDEILIVDDQAHLESELFAPIPVPEGAYFNYVRTEWWSGPAVAWNMGVALARNNLCILMGSDDKLFPTCFERLRLEYKAQNQKDAWYNFTILLENGEMHSVFNNAAAVTFGLWKRLGGFPPSSGVGGMDALLISIMLIHMPDRLLQVAEGTPLYWVRQHSGQDTLKQASLFSSEIVSIRNKETARYTGTPAWTNLFSNKD